MELIMLWKKYNQFIKFSVVGASNTLITLVVYYILVEFGINYMLSNVLAYSSGVANSYLWNSIWVFQVKSNIKSNLSKFIIVNLGTLFISTAFLYVCVDILKLHKMLAQIIVTGIVMVINYGANKLWTFKIK